MAKLPKIANTEGNTEGLTDFSPVPDGDYAVVIKKSEYVQTKAKTGYYLKLEIAIVEGEYRNKKLWANLNLDNPNPKAVEFANRTLNSICKACGKVGVEDSEELHGIVMCATVTLKPATAMHPAGNEIKFFKEYEGDGRVDTPPVEKKADKVPWDDDVDTPEKYIQENPEINEPEPKMPWELVDDDVPF